MRLVHRTLLSFSVCGWSNSSSSPAARYRPKITQSTAPISHSPRSISWFQDRTMRSKKLCAAFVKCCGWQWNSSDSCQSTARPQIRCSLLARRWFRYQGDNYFDQALRKFTLAQRRVIGPSRGRRQLLALPQRAQTFAKRENLREGSDWATGGMERVGFGKGASGMGEEREWDFSSWPTLNPLGPLGSSSSQHRRTLELILPEGSNPTS